jgi:hypothetical protein
MYTQQKGQAEHAEKLVSNVNKQVVQEWCQQQANRKKNSFSTRKKGAS